MKLRLIFALIISVVSLNAIAGHPRCAGSSEPEKCEQFQAELASETPATKAARIKKLEKNRQATASQVSKQPLIRPTKCVKGSARIGMSTDENLATGWCKPSSVNRTINASGTFEQWVYDSGNYLYFTNGVLTSIQN